MQPLRHLAAIAALSVAASAQDMLAVDWVGQIWSLDSYTGAAEPIGVGLFGQNAMARDGAGVVWSYADASGTTGAGVITRIDPASLTATAMFPTQDVRALAAGPGSTLYAVLYSAGINELVSIDTVTGAHTSIGVIGPMLIQGMTMHNGELLAWDLGLGLGRLSLTTATFFPRPGPGGNIQWLAVRNDGQLVGGGLELYAIDPVSGARTLLAGGIPYLRGADTAAFAAPFGAGCQGGSGIVELAVRGDLRPGSLLTTQSTGHSPTGALIGGWGALVIGTSRTSYAGQNLPLLLDPLLGTQGCHLHVSNDASLLAPMFSTSPVMLQFILPIPGNLPFATLHVQHFGFDQVPGGVSASNGVTLRIAN